jgi:hypothetical protein
MYQIYRWTIHSFQISSSSRYFSASPRRAHGCVAAMGLLLPRALEKGAIYGWAWRRYGENKAILFTDWKGKQIKWLESIKEKTKQAPSISEETFSETWTGIQGTKGPGPIWSEEGRREESYRQECFRISYILFFHLLRWR